MNIENISSFGAIIGGGFFRGVLVIKVIDVVVGLFFAGLVYLQYQQIVNINWGKLREVSQNTGATFVNATTQIPGGHIASVSNVKPWYPTYWQRVYRSHNWFSKRLR